jgi:hypothetical protein
MIRTCVRWIAGLHVLAFLIPAQAQTIERYAGGARLADSPALQTPISPGEMAAGPDGRIFVIHENDGSIYRLDPGDQTASLMPEEQTEFPNWPPVYNYFRDLTVDDANGVYAAQGSSIRKLDLVNGGDEFFAGSDYASQNTRCNGTPFYPARFGSVDDMATLPGGRVLVADGVENLICILEAPSGDPDPRASSRVFAGRSDGFAGFEGDGGPPWDALFRNPQAIATDAQSNVYIADTGNYRIRRFSAADIWMPGNIETIVGTGVEGYNGDGIPATSAQISEARYLTADGAGNLYFYDQYNHRVRRVDGSTGLISTVAGNGEGGYAGPPEGGQATSAALPELGGLLLSPDGGLYLSERFNRRVRRVDLATGTITTVLGNGTTGYCGEGPRLKTCFDQPAGVAVDAQGNVYVADLANNLVRKIDAATGLTRTLAGKAPAIQYDGIGEIVSSEHSGDGGPAAEATFGSGPWGVAVDAAGNVYIATGFDHRIRRIDATSGIITTIAGNGSASSSGDGGPAVNATVNMPIKIAIASNGDVYFSENHGQRVRKIDAVTGIISTAAGNGLTTGSLGDGGSGPLASLSGPEGLAFDRDGNLLIADQAHLRIRKLYLTTGIITTVAGNGINGWEGDGGPATAAQLGYPLTLAVDAANNIFLTTGFRLRRIDAITGVINRANASWGLYTPDGYGIQSPTQMAFGPDGSLFISDTNDSLVFRVSDLPLAPADTTPPVITPVITGTLGNDGWYLSNVTVNWTASDPESAYEWPGSGCGTRTVTTDTAGVTYTCTTTSAGGVASKSVTIKRDTVAPTLTFGTASPSADANGWRHTDVSVPFTTSDATSGVLSTSGTSPLVITGRGTGLNQTVTVTDRAGNAATFTTPSFDIDGSTPVIQSSVNGAIGSNGWYRGDVQVSWTVTDPESTVTSTTGCGATMVSSDTAGTTFTCTAASGGGSFASSITVKRDATPPALTFGSPAPAPNATGWNTGDVAFTFSASDATSGVASSSAPNPLIVTGAGAGLQAEVIVSDAAGNSSTFTTPPVNIDRTAPLLLPQISGTLGDNGWYTSDVQLAWAIDELPGSVLGTTGCEPASVTADTAGVTFNCSVTSAGGTTQGSVTIKRDATPPVLSFGTPSPAPNSNGWNKTNVSIPFTRSDALSGLASTSTSSPLVLGTEGSNVTGQVVVTDKAGNVATFTSVPRNIDKTAPQAEMNTPEDNATYGFYQDVTADFWCTDSLLVSCTAPTANGELINTRTAGARTYKVTAKDSVYTTTHTHAYQVESSFNFGGFLAPVSAPPTLNLVTRGSLVPIRWRLPDGRGGYVTNPASFSSASVGSLSCGSAPAVPLDDTATGAAGIGFDAATSSFVYNWQTGASWTGCRKLTIKLKDNSTHELRFKFH